MSAKLKVFSEITDDGKYYLVDGRKIDIKIRFDFGHGVEYRDWLTFEMNFMDEDINQLRLKCIKEAVLRWNNIVLAGVE